MANRPAHLAYAHDEKNPAKVKIGGPYLDEKGDMCGSLIILEAPDQGDGDPLHRERSLREGGIVLEHRRPALPADDGVDRITIRIRIAQKSGLSDSGMS